MPIKRAIEKLLQQQSLDSMETQQVMLSILQDDIHSSQIAAFLVLLRAKKESIAEMMGLIQAMQQHMIEVPLNETVLDITGTGGDQAGTVNISTAAAILIAACGVKVAKHGNRAVSSQCGSADVLEALGISMDLTPEQIVDSIAKVGIGFCFAPHFHPALMKLREVRRELKVPTVINLIAPLVNPAKPQYHLLGVADKAMVPAIAKVLMQMGTRRSMVYHSEGLDELTCINEAEVVLIEEKQSTLFKISPAKLGLNPCTLSDLKGGSAQYNAKMIRETLSGQKTNLSDTLVLNAAAALYVAEQCSDLPAAVERASTVLQRGTALQLLDQWANFCHDKRTAQ